jgi:hypothetical protein
MGGPRVVLAILGVQAVCALVFVWDLAATLLGLRASPIGWQTRELMEIGAAVGLLLGLGLGRRRSFGPSAAVPGSKANCAWPRGRSWICSKTGLPTGS